MDDVELGNKGCLALLILLPIVFYLMNSCVELKRIKSNNELNGEGKEGVKYSRFNTGIITLEGHRYYKSYGDNVLTHLESCPCKEKK